MDFDGFVYIGGVSWGGVPPSEGSGTGFDFCILKLTSGGQTVWPNSGGGTGYAFHNGAVRTTSPLNEGANGQSGVASNVNAPMAIRQDWTPENRIIAIAGKARDWLLSQA